MEPTSPKQIDWRLALQQLQGIEGQERQIVELLAAGHTQPQIGKQLGLHRSAVWRRIRRLRVQLSDLDTQATP